MAKIYFHVDVNSAFLSWSALKHLQDGDVQDLRTIPAVVGGDEAKRHGVVLAKSGPAKKYGIQTGESLFAARAKCPGLTIVPPDFDFYVQNSKALIKILGDYTPDVEQYSIDEAFLDMTGTEALFGPPLTVAHTIRRRVKRELGFTVNVGIAPNRLLAKMASDFEKPDRVHTLYKYEIETKMWPLPVGDLFGVGPSAAKKLNSFGICTIGDFARLDRETATRMFGSRGETLWNYANGRETDPVTKQGSRDNSYGNSVTMPQDLPRPEDADATMLALCDSVGRRLRADGKTARVVTVQLVDNAFRRTSHQTTLLNPTNSTDRLYHVAAELMRQMWPVRPVRLVGVSAEKTGEDNFEQMDFFTDAARTDKQEKLDRAADALRRKFGGAAVTRATLLTTSSRKPEALSAAKEREKGK
nr:DNA polymerase IV [uncultured Gemmiger sp.]